jgi:protease-4
MSGKSQNDPFSGQIMGSDTIVKALHEAADDENVKAIVLRVNSPGGSALASDLIWRATQAIDKPIVASMGDVAGSGGYYISMGADRIVAEPGTITGSIGVVGGKFNMSGLYDKIGITTDVISRGKNSGMFTSTANFSDSERQVVSAMMHDVYRIFTTKAAEGRKMSLEKLEALAGGQVYTGRDAKRNGLVDQLGTLKDAIQLAKQLAGIDPDEKTILKVLPEPENPFDAIFGIDSNAEKEVRMLGGLRHLMPELTEPLQRAVQVQRIMRDPVALMMPFWIEIK